MGGACLEMCLYGRYMFGDVFVWAVHVWRCVCMGGACLEMCLYGWCMFGDVFVWVMKVWRKLSFRMTEMVNVSFYLGS